MRMHGVRQILYDRIAHVEDDRTKKGELPRDNDAMIRNRAYRADFRGARKEEASASWVINSLTIVEWSCTKRMLMCDVRLRSVIPVVGCEVRQSPRSHLIKR